MTIEIPTDNRSYGKPLSGFGAVFSWGLLRSFRGKRAWIGMIVAGALGYFMGAGSQEVRIDKLGSLWSVIDGEVLKTIAPVIALLMIAQGFSSEVRGGTLLYHLVRPVSRPVFFMARYLSGLLVGLLVTAIFVVGLALSATSVPLTIWLQLFAAMALAVLASGAMYYVLSSIFKHGLIIGLVYTFTIEAAIGSMPNTIQKGALTHHARAIFHGLADPWFAENSKAVARSVKGESAAGRDSIIAQFDQVPFDTPAAAALVLVVVTLVVLTVGVLINKSKQFPLKD